MRDRESRGGRMRSRWWGVGMDRQKRKKGRRRCSRRWRGKTNSLMWRRKKSKKRQSKEWRRRPTAGQREEGERVFTHHRFISCSPDSRTKERERERAEDSENGNWCREMYWRRCFREPDSHERQSEEICNSISHAFASLPDLFFSFSVCEFYPDISPDDTLWWICCASLAFSFFLFPVFWISIDEQRRRNVFCSRNRVEQIRYSLTGGSKEGEHRQRDMIRYQSCDSREEQRFVLGKNMIWNLDFCSNRKKEPCGDQNSCMRSPPNLCGLQLSIYRNEEQENAISSLPVTLWSIYLCVLTYSSRTMMCNRIRRPGEERE